MTEPPASAPPPRPKHNFKRKVWALLYLHDWDPDGGVYPEIHGVYDDEATALVDWRAMSNKDLYHLHQAYFLEGNAALAAQPPEPQP